MTQEIKDEAIDQLKKDIQFGFETEEELFESIREIFYDIADFDEEWLKQTISEKFSEHQKSSSAWETPTDFDRLAGSFDELIAKKIICLHNAGYTSSDGIDDCNETREELDEHGIKAIGFCYYHAQDLERAIDPKSKKLPIGFGAYHTDEKAGLEIAATIVETLRANGFSVNWTGTADKRIEIININWQKIPDDEDWGIYRVIDILTEK